MTDKVTVGLLDFAGKRTWFGFTVPDEIGASLDSLQTAVTDIVAAMGEISACLPVGTNIGVSEAIDNDKPTDTEANREVGVRFVLKDPLGNKTSVTLGGPIMAKFPFASQGVDIIQLPYAGLDADVATFVGLLQSHAIHPISGLGLTGVSIEKIGRNL